MQIQPVSSPPVSENVLAPSRESSILDISDHAIENNSDSFRGDRLQDEPPLSITGLDSTDYSHSELHANAGSTQTTTSPMRTQVAPTTPSVMEREENPDPEVDTPFAPPAPAQSEFSLQEAFLRRKKNFVKKSQQRLEQIKATIEEQKFQQASTLKESFGRKHSRNPNSSTSFGSKSSFSGSQKQKLDSEVEKKRRVVTFASPLLQTSAEPAKPHSTQKGTYCIYMCMYRGVCVAYCIYVFFMWCAIEFMLCLILHLQANFLAGCFQRIRKRLRKKK